MPEVNWQMPLKNYFYQFAYILILFLVLLFPFNFDFRTNHTKWLSSENGIHFPKGGQIISVDNTIDFYKNLIHGKGLTLELWLKTASLIQTGPARIISYSMDHSFRNFTLGQSGDKLIMRLRTELTDPNGVFPHLVIPDVFQGSEKTYIFVTYDFEKQCVFINGENRICDHKLKGNFSNWDPSFKLVIGNEASGNRPWLGKIYFAAIYDQALQSDTITEKYKSGISEESYTISQKACSQYPTTVCYSFNEKKGSLVADSGMGGINLNLEIPKRLPTKEVLLNTNQLSNLIDHILTLSCLFHMLIFIPLGIFLRQYLMLRLQSLFVIVAIILIVGLIISLGSEILQHFLPDRTSSIIDVLANLIGLCIGIIAHGFLLKKSENLDNRVT